MEGAWKSGWSEYLSIKEINCQESRENNMLKSVTVCIIPTNYYAYEHITEEKKSLGSHPT
jgi:hypothetical protein